MPIKSALVSIIRHGALGYVRLAPWKAGKVRALRTYHDHVGWRPHRSIVRTKFGAKMDVTLPDTVAGTIYATRAWEPCITEYISRGLKPGDTFVDVGANIGYYSLLASKIVGPTGSVVAIEASPMIFGRLRRNLEINDSSNVRAINVAASDRKGTLTTYLADAINLGHSTTVAELAAREGQQQEAQVPADTIEHLVGRSLFTARFIKIDVEGAELSVLTPLFPSLGKFSERTEWLLELSPGFSAGGQSDVTRIFDTFRAAGYRAYRIPNEYKYRFQISPPPCVLTELAEAPTSLCDVVMSRRGDAGDQPCE
jgi:FkbM family methyltransferase